MMQRRVVGSVWRSAQRSASFGGWRRSFAAEAGTPERVMEDKIKEAFGEGTKASVKDVSGGCGSSYDVVVESPKFKEMNRVQQSRSVHKVLEEHIPGIHAIQVKTKAL